MSIKIGINGFGRIGRLVFRAALKNPDLEVVAINDLTDAATMAHLLTYDSVHGKLDLDIKAQNDSIEVDGKSIAFTSIKDPEQLKWKDLGVDIRVGELLILVYILMPHCTAHTPRQLLGGADRGPPVARPRQQWRSRHP